MPPTQPKETRNQKKKSTRLPQIAGNSLEGVANAYLKATETEKDQAAKIELGRRAYLDLLTVKALEGIKVEGKSRREGTEA